MASRFDQTTEAPERGARRVDSARFLILVHGEDAPRPIRLERRLTVGRDPGDDGLTIDDGRASRRHCEIAFVPEYGVYRLRDLDSRNGTWLDGQRTDDGHLRHGSVLRVGDSLFVFAEIPCEPGVEPTPSLRQRAERLVDRVAPTDLSVLVIGPTGAGKELLAQRLHTESGRRGSLVAVNCGAFGNELLSSELFGHVRGAFSGAHGDRDGLFVAAEGGTLFLDEVGEMALAQQPALLRALQERRVRPVGADRDRPVDVRIIAATHRSLDDGVFRADLHARLAGFTIELPGLVDRRDEILPLFRSFLGERAPALSADAAEALLLHDWPHNVRGLQAAASRVKLFSEHVIEIDLSLLPADVQRRVVTGSSAAESGAPTRERLVELLTEHAGNVAGVARALGQHRQQLYRWLRAHALDPSEYRG